MSSDLSGSRVLVTGANRGLGRRLVEAALARNAATVYAAARDPDSLPPFADAVRVVPVRLDVTDADEIAAAARAHPEIDVLVSNAGISCFGPVLDGDETAMRRAVEVNFFGPLRLVQAFGANLRRPGAGVVFVLSVASVALSRSSPGYSVSKAAALMLALSVREELAGSGGSVTVLLPGFIDTELSASLSMPKASAASVAERAWDGWLAGEPTIWPDRFAESVRDVVGAPYRELIAEPRRVMTDLQVAFRDREGDAS
jgi:NAD(P)-dependent dehydrogenase (short-subunit alcohol dehydrogenase family)